MPYNILTIFKYNSQWNHVYEDPDFTKRRIFIQNQGYDTYTLSPRFNEIFLGVGTDNIVNNSPMDDWSSHIPIQTNQKWMWGRHYSRQEVWDYLGHSDPWFCSLDYENIPGRHSVRTSLGFSIFQHYSNYSTNTGLADFWVGQDLTQIPRHLNYNVGNLVTFFYEDPTITEEFYAMRFDQGTYYLGKARVTGTTVTFTAGRTVTDRNMFFVGKNADGTALFAEIQGSTQSIDFVKLTSGNTWHQTISWIHPGISQNHYQFLSNIRHASGTRKVFYQGGWDRHNSEEYRQAFFTRFEWNPVSQNIVQTPCTLVYPSGKTHIDYQQSARYDPALHSTTRNAWWYKPHQFTVGGVNYLTFIFIDRSNQSFNTERAYFRNKRNQDTWVTFTIGSGTNDNVLTYHSTFQWQQHRNFPQYYMPTTPAGNQLIILRPSTLSTLTFDSVVGWIEHDIENISVRSLGIDDSGRILVGAAGTLTWEDTSTSRFENTNNKGFGIVADYRPSQPIIISSNVIAGDYTTSNTTFSYTGSPINTGLAISARNSVTGSNVVANVRLIITGGNAVFDTGTREKIVNTSNTIASNVALTINGGGRPIITAHVIV